MSAPVGITPAMHGRNLLGSFTRLTKGLAALLVISYVICLIFPSAIVYFALLPGRTIPFAWNLLTAGFVETNIFLLCLDAAALLFLGRLLEPGWGTKELMRFIVLTSTFTSACTFVLMVCAYYFTFRGDFLYAPICGFHGVIAGFLVALKQIMPDQEIPFLPIKLRVKWLPSLLVVTVLVLCALLGEGILYAPFIVLGTYCSWLYLRFFQLKSDSGLKGDPSDDFAFPTFFPESLRPFVSAVSTVLGRIFCGRRLEQRGEEDPVAPGMPLPGSDPVDASRRRERGAKALEERLAKAAGGGAAAPAAAAGAADASAAPTEVAVTVEPSTATKT